jgi:hypothetical protein
MLPVGVLGLRQRAGILSVDANDLSQEIPTNAGYSGGAQLT